MNQFDKLQKVAERLGGFEQDTETITLTMYTSLGMVYSFSLDATIDLSEQVCIHLEDMKEVNNKLDRLCKTLLDS